MTYTVLAETLNHAQSINQNMSCDGLLKICIVVISRLYSTRVHFTKCPGLDLGLEFFFKVLTTTLEICHNQDELVCTAVALFHPVYICVHGRQQLTL